METLLKQLNRINIVLDEQFGKMDKIASNPKLPKAQTIELNKIIDNLVDIINDLEKLTNIKL